LTNNTSLRNFEVEHDFEQIGQKIMLLNAWKIIQTGETPRILLAIEDITRRKQFEAERLRLLSQEQAARQEAEAANRAKDESLSNLSHELRNPLNIMLGWSQLLRSGRLNAEDMGRALESIEQSAKAQSQLIEDMLDLSRITSGKLRLNPRPLDLVSVVNLAIDAVQLVAEAKSIQIVSHFNAVTIVGDRDRLQQVMWNLISNAIKFTPAGGRIDITVSPKQDAAEIQVSDTGQGISAELLPYVFDRFRQGDSSTTKAWQGLGLGLAIVRHIVELHGGTVRADSPGVGKGTTMTVRLPLYSNPEDFVQLRSDVEPLAEEPLELVNSEVPSLKGLCILAVDDEVASLDLIRYILESVGATVVTVTSARVAIAALTDSPGQYDVLLADIGMPEEDGLTLIRQVRTLDVETGGQIPAVATTAYASQRERQQALDAGFQMHMPKPIDPTRLIWAVATLGKRVGSDAADAKA